MAAHQDVADQCQKRDQQRQQRETLRDFYPLF